MHMHTDTHTHTLEHMVGASISMQLRVYILAEEGELTQTTRTVRFVPKAQGKNCFIRFEQSLWAALDDGSFMYRFIFSHELVKLQHKSFVSRPILFLSQFMMFLTYLEIDIQTIFNQCEHEIIVLFSVRLPLKI